MQPPWSLYIYLFIYYYYYYFIFLLCVQYTVYVFAYLCISIERDHAVLKWRSWSIEQQYFCKWPPYVILHVDDGGALKINLWFFKATTDPLSLPRALESSGWSLDAGCGGCGDYWWISSPVGRHLFLRNQVELRPGGRRGRSWAVIRRSEPNRDGRE